MSCNSGGECAREGVTRRFVGGIEVPFTGRATHHQRAHAHEARPQSSDKFGKHPYSGTGTLKNILVEKETWLDRLNGSAAVLNGKVTIIETLVNRILDDFVIAMVLALRPKGMLPMGATSELGPRHELHCKDLEWPDIRHDPSRTAQVMHAQIPSERTMCHSRPVSRPHVHERHSRPRFFQGSRPRRGRDVHRR